MSPRERLAVLVCFRGGAERGAGVRRVFMRQFSTAPVNSGISRHGTRRALLDV